MLWASSGCVCFQPVEEFTDSGIATDSGIDAPVEPAVRSFVAPVPVDDLADIDWLEWSVLNHLISTGRHWRRITPLANGDLLLDAVGGVVHSDGGYVSAANADWRAASHDSINTSPRWAWFNGDWYRYTFWVSLFGPSSDPMRFWRLNRDTTQLELRATVASAFSSHFPRVSATAIWGGSRLWVNDCDGDGHGRDLTGTVTIAASVDTMSGAATLTQPFHPLESGVDRDTGLIWAAVYWPTGTRYVLLRFQGTDVLETEIDGGTCSVPYLQRPDAITLGCEADGGVEVWVADRDGARLVGRDEVPPNVRRAPLDLFLVQLNPYRAAFVSEADGGRLLNLCDSERCVESIPLFSSPPNAGIDDAGALYVADYVRDAGVRVTRFAPGSW